MVQNSETMSPEKHADPAQQEKPDNSAGSQAATTGYGTGQVEGQAASPAQNGKDTPSNAGDAGFQGAEGGRVSEERMNQMSRADGSNESDDPDV